MRKARIEAGRVVEILEAEPFPDFHPDLEWVECPSEVKQGYLYSGGAFSAPPSPDKTVPEVVTMRQARLALLRRGLLPQVEALIAALPGETGAEARIEWEYSQAVDWESPLVQHVAAALGWSQPEVSALFAEASSL